jgi:hypothetical protein
MKTYKFVLLIFISFLFCNGSCEHEEGQRFTIQNNSSEKIVPAFAYFPMDSINICIKPTNKFERAALERVTILANSSQRQEGVASIFINRPQDTLYVHIYNRIDIDNMSCEEFNRERPILKSWAITKADAEAMNWILVYSPKE